MEKIDMIDQEIWKKRRQLEELEEDYYHSRKKIENAKEESDYRLNDLHRMLEEKHTVASHMLSQIEGDTSMLHYQLNQLATDFSQQMDLAYRKRLDQLETEESNAKQKYSREYRELDEELTQILAKQRHIQDKRE
ncbi:hypothetical protein [Streptococcus australis]|nr:hypothetical protein [Streptococcus australis]